MALQYFKFKIDCPNSKRSGKKAPQTTLPIKRIYFTGTLFNIDIAYNLKLNHLHILMLGDFSYGWSEQGNMFTFTTLDQGWQRLYLKLCFIRDRAVQY